jgi:hypothetical protein
MPSVGPAVRYKPAVTSPAAVPTWYMPSPNEVKRPVGCRLPRDQIGFRRPVRALVVRHAVCGLTRDRRVAAWRNWLVLAFSLGVLGRIHHRSPCLVGNGRRLGTDLAQCSSCDIAGLSPLSRTTRVPQGGVNQGHP